MVLETEIGSDFNFRSLLFGNTSFIGENSIKI